VLAGRAAGMRVWGFAGGAHMTHRMSEELTRAGAERIANDWSEAAGLFRALGAG
jgi:beta-phosphoglucomutase-like phosphatase (HAD superfamily)